MLLDPTAWLIVIAFSVLGSLRDLALYQVGKQGVDAIRKRFPRIKPEQWQRVEQWHDQYGRRVLLLSGVPVLGLLLTTAAGSFGLPRPAFLLLVTIGRMLRNWLLAILLAGIYSYLKA